MYDAMKYKKIILATSLLFPLLLTSCFVKRDDGKGAIDDDSGFVPTPPPDIPDLDPDGDQGDKKARYFDMADDEGANTRDYSSVKTLTTTEIKNKVLGGWLGHVYGLGSGFEYVIARNKEGTYLYGNADTQNATSGDATISYTGTAGTIKGLYFDNSIIGLDDTYFESGGAVCTGSLGSNKTHGHLAPISEPRVIQGNVFSDDDINVDVLNQFIFRDYGPLLSNSDLTNAWNFYDVVDLGGGKYAQQVIDSGYIAPFTGTAQYGNEAYWNTEGWIENETLGFLFPYMYESCASYADMFTHLQSDGDTCNLGVLSALMYSLAYEYDDTKVIMEKAFNYLPHSNMLYEMYQYVKSCYEADKAASKDLDKAWRNTCLGVANRYALVMNHCGDNDRVGYSINACAGMIFTALFYGENDFRQSLKIVSLCGLDGDCTAATVGGLLGIMKGYDALPNNYKNFLNKDSYYCNVTPLNKGSKDGHIDQCAFRDYVDFGYMNQHFPNYVTFNDLANLTVENVIKLTKSFGGTVTGSNVNILKQPVRNASNSITINNYSFEDGTTEGWSFRGESGASLNVVEAISECHLGKHCGVINLGEITDTSNNVGTAYQTLSLTKGNTYTYSIWVKGGADREAHLFAKDSNGTQFKSIVNNKGDSNAYAKMSFTFTATSESMEVGIDYPKSYADAGSNIIYIDDAQIVDVSINKQKIHRKGYEFEEVTYEGATEKKGSHFSNDIALKFDSDYVPEAIIDFDGVNRIQTFRIYYYNLEEDFAKLAISVDDNLICYADLLPTGIVDEYSASNYFDFTIYIGEGKHSISLQLIDGICYMDGFVIEDAYRSLN